MNNKNRGFVAFILVISISTLILVFSFMQSIEYGHFFDEVRTKEYRLMSYYFAYSCLDQALLALNHDFFFSIDKNIDKPIDFSDLNCSIDAVYEENGLKVIEVYGKYKNINVYRKTKVRLFDDHIEFMQID
jgi:hypothetical protein